jgi:putative Holliday junction resolvase
MARLMAIDFGRRRCGIAVTDPACIIANPLETVDTPKLIDFVKAYLKANQVDKIVVGLPKNLNGEPSESMRYLTPVINRLKKEVAPTPIVYFDERFTSVLAHRAMIDGGMKKMDRRDKAVVDRISASIILNDYLSSNF